MAYAYTYLVKDRRRARGSLQTALGGGSSYQRKSTPGASVLGLGGGVVPSLGGGAMNLASLLGGGGLQSQMIMNPMMNPLAGVLGGSSGLLGTASAGVPGRGAGILEYPDAGAEDANHDATRIPQGCRTNTTGMPLGCLPATMPATSELHVGLGREPGRAGRDDIHVLYM